MTKAIFPGSFDPFTVGHYDIVKRGLQLFDEIIISIGRNSTKKETFPIREREEAIRKIFADEPRVKVAIYDCLTVDFARNERANCIIRGLRAVTDFEYELQLFQTNKKLAPDIETVFLNTNLQYAYLSSSIVKEVASYGGEISEFVPDFVAERIREKLLK